MKRWRVNWLLLPLSGFYGLITTIRNWLFDSKLLKSTQPEVYSISVGNLTVGGTGKTPMVEFLIKRYLRSSQMAVNTLATLSRGYGRKTTGFRVATNADTAETIGDEPLQLYRKCKGLVRVCVGERRVKAIQTLLNLHPQTRQIILDDAFQHRPVRPHLNILLMDYNRPFYEDFPFPAGRLRERRSGARRADAIVVTKCPINLWETEQQRIIKRIRPYTQPDSPVFFASIAYGQPVSFGAGSTLLPPADVVLVSGLANANPLEQYVQQTYRLMHHHRFADHYAYTRSDLDQLMANLPPNTALLTTEKDWVKLDALLNAGERVTWPLFYLPIAVSFLPGQEPLFTDFLDENTLKNR